MKFTSLLASFFLAATVSADSETQPKVAIDITREIPATECKEKPPAWIAHRTHSNPENSPVSPPPLLHHFQIKSQHGDKISMHYTGWVEASGKQIDSSRSRKTPFNFIIGKSIVIQGWHEGFTDMCIGEKRTLTIPSELAYGKHDAGTSGPNGTGNVIPGGSTLIFDVELLDIMNRKAEEKGAEL
ncbi:Peptidyl-prolyl cis-trans isomerase fpr2 [Podochytrium sp. JEL0797]|nr:Peptidyl-prolyl cis-trans isomerase fpr2 [Podochytrium sp. JEL0797]